MPELLLLDRRSLKLLLCRDVPELLLLKRTLLELLLLCRAALALLLLLGLSPWLLVGK